ncbi:MAG: UDP-3-O-acyl-N-acetylglucosamine deacetylase [Limnochordales bacterium]|nr:UDP-3-O-acyl-N-acetylglucosamine deacetylase [Limnochordales bacterium]
MTAVAEASGVALHTGVAAHVRLRAARPGSGILFVRTDLPGSPSIPASITHVIPERRSTALSDPATGATIRTVEHFLATCFVLGVQDCILEVDGPELPAGDGAALYWVDLVRQAGLDVPACRYDAPKLPQPVVIEDEEGDVATFIAAFPADEFSAYYVFVPPYPGQAVQVAAYVDGSSTDAADFFVRNLAPARTPAFLEEIATLREAGLGLGVSEEQTCLLSAAGPVGKWRFPDEPARHKLVDLLGDLFLAGRFRARLVAVRTGHRHNALLARRVWEMLGGR